MKLYDVAIVGGGPSGASLAMSLSRNNRSVVMIERSDYSDEWQYGEILSAEASALLSKLDIKIENLLLEVPHIRSQGVLAAWGSSELREKHSIFNPYGTAWHIDRKKFDAALAMLAEDAGAQVLRKTACIFTAYKDDCWKLAVSDHVGKPMDLMARLVVDATGRAAQVASRAGARICFFDQLISIIGIVKHKSHSEPAAMTVMTMESTQNGWWYVVPLPSGELLAAFMTDSDIFIKAKQSPITYWKDMLKNTLHISRLLGEFQLSAKIQVKTARTSRLDIMCGKHWLAVGDAAFALDPLSGDGIHRAIQSGLESCDAILGSLEHAGRRFDQYSERLSMIFNSNWIYRRDYYGSEKRWPNSAFWHRRHKLLASESNQITG